MVLRTGNGCASSAPGYRGDKSVLIKVIRGTIVGGERVAAGETVEASYSDAKYLINTGKAEETKPKPARRKKPKADPADV